VRLAKWIVWWVALLWALVGVAQEQPKNPDPTLTTVFPHSMDSRFWVSGQINFIFQAHPDFPALYRGQHSLSPYYENATSQVLTLFTGFQATRNTDLLLDVESSGGRGISDALGLAGFTNLDVVRNPDLGSVPYVARLMVHQIIPLSSEREESDRTSLALSTSAHSSSGIPVRETQPRRFFRRKSGWK